MSAARLLEIGIEAVLLATGIALLVPAVYLLVLALAATVDRVRPALPRAPMRAARRVTVVVPAHDEALLIGRCVAALLDQTLERERYAVVVVADNCSDDTAALARAAGARVLVRTAPAARGKGHALRFAMDVLLSEIDGPDALAVVDADTVADRDFLAALVAAYEGGADAAQGVSLLDPDSEPRSQLRAAAFLLINRVRSGGRARLGLTCTLQGNGMFFAGDVLRQHPWDAFTSAEDLEYSVRLRLAGERVEFVPGAILHSPTAPSAQAADLQSERWEGGKLYVARTLVPALIRCGLRDEPALLEMALGILVPPLGLLTGLASGGALVAGGLALAGAMTWWPFLPFALALAAIACFVLLGLWAAAAPSSAYRALAGGPGLVLRKLFRLRRVLGHRAETWVRTDRREA